MALTESYLILHSVGHSFESLSVVEDLDSLKLPSVPAPRDLHAWSGHDSRWTAWSLKPRVRESSEEHAGTCVFHLLQLLSVTHTERYPF